MKHNIYSILLATSAIFALPSCEKEAAFSMKPGEGQLNCDALSVDYINRGRNTRAAHVEIGDFNVNFVNTATQEVTRSFKYAEMPEIVALPAGTYRAEAEYGDNPIAEWEDPYYAGNSTFKIEVGKVTDDVDPIECTLSNIKVTVNVNDLGLGLLDDDVKVIVSAGAEGKLTYDASTNNKAGYFRYIDGSSTIAAEFTGTVDGVGVDQTVLYDDVEEGNSYSINFEINRPDNMNPGSIVITDSGITLNATITIQDETKVIDPNEPDDDILVDDMRPDQDGSGDDPKKDPTTSNPPRIIPLSDGLVLNECNKVSECSFKVVSDSKRGFTGFKIKIESDVLTKDELESIGLTDVFDLINPGAYGPILSNFGFCVGDEVKGKQECSFSITPFLSLIPGAGDHKFHLTVTDEFGTTAVFIGITTED